MKYIIKAIILPSCFVLTGLAAQAQSAEQPPQESWSDSGYNEEWRETESEQPGVASYNIDDGGEMSNTDGAWRNEEQGGYARQTETINIYSGRQEGNNVVRTIQVPLPDGQDGYYSLRVFQPQ